MTFRIHVLINNFTGKNAPQDSNSAVNTAGYSKKQICIHSQECLYQEPIAKRQFEYTGVQLHTMLDQIRYNFRFGVCSPGADWRDNSSFLPWSLMSRTPFAYPAPHITVGVPTHRSSPTSWGAAFVRGNTWLLSFDSSELPIDSKHLKKCPPTLHGAILLSYG